MDRQLHCPKCDLLLRVPAHALGQRLSCPSCHTQFTLSGSGMPGTPAAGGAGAAAKEAEDTIASWIAQDVDEVIEERARTAEQRLAPYVQLTAWHEGEAGAKAAGKPGTSAPAQGEAAGPGSKTAPGKADAGQPPVRPGSDAKAPVSPDSPDGGDEDSLEDLELPGLDVPEGKPENLDDWVSSAAKEFLEDERAENQAAVTQEPSAEPEPPAAPTTASKPSEPTRREPGAAAAAAAGREAGGETEANRPAYPTELFVSGRIPHLVVRQCSHSGVTLAFDSSWLEHDGFRASMPMRCIYTGRNDPADLLARPLAFIDRSQAKVRSAQQIESRHEQQAVGKLKPMDLVRVMGLTEGLPKPFNYTVPYYIHSRYAHLSAYCTTHSRPDGITCEVMIPDPGTALEWLMRVNGVCGADYEMLAHEVELLQSDTWRQLPETCRQRLGVWCVFEPRERFVLYVNDGDFGQVDAGLAGLVLTDRRLFYRKYHRGGQVRLTEPALLIVQTDDRFAHLTLDHEERRARILKLHLGELPKLLEALGSPPGLQVEVVNQPG